MSKESKKREGPTLRSTVSEPTTLSTNKKNIEKITKTIEKLRIFETSVAKEKLESIRDVPKLY
jgi:hypothetical protein